MVPIVVYAVTIPSDAPIDAIDGALLLHVPPVVALVSVLVPLVQVLNAPPMAAGVGFTDSVRLLLEVQPLNVEFTVYVIVGVVVTLAAVTRLPVVALRNVDGLQVNVALNGVKR